jgi:membrane-associated protease RseP (regulator of RpoE activity)
MRRIPTLLCVVGLAAAPASAVAGPSKDSCSTGRTVEKFEWSTSKGRLGVRVTSLTSELRKHLGAPEDRGVLVASVEPNTPAAKAGIQVGDVIVEVRGRKIDGAFDVLSALADVGKGELAKIELVRAGSSRTVEATLSDNAPPKTLWSPPWLRDWMKPFGYHLFESPFDESSWFHDWPKLDDVKPQTDTTIAPTNWRDALRTMFVPKLGPVYQRT